MKFEEKLSRAREGALERLAWEQACRDEEEKWSRSDRKASWNGKSEFLESYGMSVKDWNDQVRLGWDKIRSAERSPHFQCQGEDFSTSSGYHMG